MKILNRNKMKKIIYLFTALLIVSCSTDDSGSTPDPIQGCTDPQAVNYNPDADINDNSCLYSIIGVWDVISAKLNGQELLGVNIGSELYFIYDQVDDNTLVTGSFATPIYTDLVSYSIGTWYLPDSNTWINQSEIYDADGNIIGSYDISWTITEINASIFEITATNYPNTGDVYVKRLSKTDEALPEL